MTTRILVVDDNELNLKLARTLLVVAGYDVRVAMDAESTLDVLREWKPRLILMDLQLPGMDGLALTRQLKASPDTRDIVVVALTAYAMKGDDERAFAAGCAGYITKPVDTRAFAQTVGRYVSGPGESAS